MKSMQVSAYSFDASLMQFFSCFFSEGIICNNIIINYYSSSITAWLLNLDSF